MRTCITCAHYRDTGERWAKYQGHLCMVHAVPGEISVITGERSPPCGHACLLERLYTQDECCGPDGKLWKPKTEVRPSK